MQKYSREYEDIELVECVNDCIIFTTVLYQCLPRTTCLMSLLSSSSFVKWEYFFLLR